MDSIYFHSDIDVKKLLINDHNLAQVFEAFYLLATAFSGISSAQKVTSVSGIHYWYCRWSLQTAALALWSHLQFNHWLQQHPNFILVLLLINAFTKPNKKTTWPKAIACSEGLVKLGRWQCLVLNTNPKPRAWGKEQVRLVTEGRQIWLQEIVTVCKLSLPLSRLQAVGHSSLMSFK